MATNVCTTSFININDLIKATTSTSYIQTNAFGMKRITNALVAKTLKNCNSFNLSFVCNNSESQYALDWALSVLRPQVDPNFDYGENISGRFTVIQAEFASVFEE